MIKPKIKLNSYIIKYYGDFYGKSDNPENPYYSEMSHGWVKDPSLATQYKKEDGIFKIGQLLDNHELITKLIHIDDVPKNMTPSGPEVGFFIICNVYGKVIKLYDNFTSESLLHQEINDLNNQDILKSPHTVWRYDTGGFSRVL